MVFPGSFGYDENSHSCFSKQENTMGCLCALFLAPESAEQPSVSSACHEALQSYHCSVISWVCLSILIRMYVLCQSYKGACPLFPEPIAVDNCT